MARFYRYFSFVLHLLIFSIFTVAVQMLMTQAQQPAAVVQQSVTVEQLQVTSTDQSAVSQQSTIPSQSNNPQNLTMKSGSPAAVFSCIGLETDIVTWYISTPRQSKIFVSPNNMIADTRKYSVTSVKVNTPTSVGVSYALTVITLILEDGNTFGCDRTSQQITFANLVVIETPTGLIEEVVAQNRSSNESLDLDVGDTVIFKCSVNYGAPSMDVGFGFALDPRQDPKLSMYLGTIELTASSPSGTLYQRTVNTAIYSKTLNARYTIQQADIGKMLRCVVATSSPAYTDSFSMSVDINSPVTQVTIDPSEGDLTFGGSRHCRADGFPHPIVSWVPVYTHNLSASDAKSGEGHAILTPSNFGRHHWNCTVRNRTTGAIISYKVVVFEVIAEDEIGEHEMKSDSFGVGLGLGVGCGALLILGVALTFFILLIRRRNKKREEQNRNKSLSKSSTPPPIYTPPDNKHHWSNRETLTRSTTPLGSTTSSSSRRHQQHNNNFVQPLLVNMNPDPELRSNVPVLPEQVGFLMPPKRASCDSPGYGDLGVKQMNMSGTTPLLDDSIDASSVNRSFEYRR